MFARRFHNFTTIVFSVLLVKSPKVYTHYLDGYFMPNDTVSDNIEQTDGTSHLLDWMNNAVSVVVAVYSQLAVRSRIQGVSQ